MEIARLLGWYRIPLRSSPKVIAVDYLAFYQTAAFEPQSWRIEYVAPVRGYELTTRAELLREEGDHPNAHQEYYKVQLGALEQLAEPIRAEKWKRITFFYTTGKYFNQAKRIPELILPEEERVHLWSALRERCERYHPGELPVQLSVELTPEILAQLLGLAGSSKR